MKNILYIFLLLPVLVIGQTTTQNYIKTQVYKQATATSDATKANASVTYFDGLGRPIQQIAGKQSATGKDIITHIEYDAYGRQAREYMPYAATTNNLAYDATALSNTQAFYNTAAFENTTNPYSQKFFEASPLNRVVKQSAPGAAWLGNDNNNNDHTVKTAYFSNIESEVKRLSVNVTWDTATNAYSIIAFSDNGQYAAGQLYKTITQNENKASSISTINNLNSKLNTTEEFKNKEGQLVLTRTFNQQIDSFNGVTTTTPLDTYYVYDQFGNLTYVLPPNALGSITNLSSLCYQYKYDARNRLVEKKLPGKDWEYFVYDSLDRVVASGPALSPWDGSTTGWLITKYDAFGRIAYTGWYAGSVSPTLRKTAQTNNTYSVVTKTTSPTTIDNIQVYYTNSYPTDMKVLTINYYDNYTYANSPGAPTASTTVETQNVSINNKGLVTGNWVRALDSSTGSTGELTYSYYDVKGRPIRTRTASYLGGYVQTDTKLDFDGTPQYTITKHKRLSSSTELTTRDDFTYTDQDRLLSQTHTITGLSTQLMNYNTYNEIGQLTSKKVGNTSAAPLQKVDYAYNIRGWLKDINNVADLAANPNGSIDANPIQDLFAFKINYNGPIAQDIDASVTPLYNGNIAETTWRTASDNIQRRYGYTYDNLSRLTDSWYQIPQATVPVRNSYDEHLKYDLNGNISGLQRNGELDSATTVTEIDNLTYFYTGNRLDKVTDSSNQTAGFKDVEVAGVADYTYDVYGNMLTDKNKGITGVTYNHMNLPITVTVSGTTGGTISYLYNAAGVKLKKTVTTGGVSTVTDYLGGYQYVNAILEFFPTSEGYVKNTVVNGANNFTYVFQYKDNVGNNRISYIKDNGVLKILEEDHYYAFGLKHNGYSATQQMIRGSSGGFGVIINLVPVINPADATYKYMYNGKELQDELGLNMYDFGARNYDPAIGRWMNIDPLAEKSKRFSPYVYCNNNPVFFVDPDGRETYTGQDAVDFATGMQIGLDQKEARGGGKKNESKYNISEDLGGEFGFESADKAVEAFAQGYGQKSIDSSHEIATFIYSKIMDGVTQYGYVEPVIGTTEFNIFNLERESHKKMYENLSKYGAIFEADVHTHGSAVDRKTGIENKNSDRFSSGSDGGDIAWYRNSSQKNIYGKPVKGYVITPYGNVYFIDGSKNYRMDSKITVIEKGMKIPKFPYEIPLPNIKAPRDPKIPKEN